MFHELCSDMRRINWHEKRQWRSYNTSNREASALKVSIMLIWGAIKFCTLWLSYSPTAHSRNAKSPVLYQDLSSAV